MSDIPKTAVRAFNEQRRSAKSRGIPFLFTLPEWWGWWQVGLLARADVALASIDTVLPLVR